MQYVIKLKEKLLKIGSRKYLMIQSIMKRINPLFFH